MFQKTVIAMATLACVSMPALAQRGAPVSQGVTSSDLAAQVQQARQQNAELRIQVGALTDDLTQMTGKVETLEFLLSQSRDEINRMQADDGQLAEDISALRRELSSQKAKIQSLEARLSSSASAQGLLSSEAASQSGVNSSSSTAATSSSPVTRTTTVTSVPQSSSQVRTSVPGTRETTQSSGPRQIVRSSTASELPQRSVASDAEESPGGTLATGSLGTISASALPGEAGPLFAEARTKLLRFDYAGAEAAFRAFIEKFGDDPQAGEAHYWLGEALYQQKAYADSGSAYTTMIRSYPDDPRAPDALAKLARNLRLVGETGKACQALDELAKRYPNASGLTMDLSAVERTRSGCDS